jgi:hypothetical protein
MARLFAAKLALFAALALAPILAACHSTPPEPITVVEAGPLTPRAPETHVIVEKDHRSLVKLAVGDYLELPHDGEFEWSIRFEDRKTFDDAPKSDAGLERFKASRAGIVRTQVMGDPKICMHSDAACPLAKYSWAVNVEVD